jgi:predicted secreted hydrolase
VTGATYPQSWRFRVPGLGIDVDVTTEVPDQEMPNLMWTYWEGLVHIDGLKEGSPIGGLGFVELSGYAGRPFLWFLFPSVWGDSVIAD